MCRELQRCRTMSEQLQIPVAVIIKIDDGICSHQKTNRVELSAILSNVLLLSTYCRKAQHRAEIEPLQRQCHICTLRSSTDGHVQRHGQQLSPRRTLRGQLEASKSRQLAFPAAGPGRLECCTKPSPTRLLKTASIELSRSKDFSTSKHCIASRKKKCYI